LKFTDKELSALTEFSDFEGCDIFFSEVYNFFELGLKLEKAGLRPKVAISR